MTSSKMEASPLFEKQQGDWITNESEVESFKPTYLEQDPLVFQDEEEKGAEGDEPEEANTSKTSCTKKKAILLTCFSLVTLLFLIPAIVLVVDKNKSIERLKAPGAFQVESVSVDISQELPVVGLQVSIQESAFPKYTHVTPTYLECVFFKWDWGSTLLVSIEELDKTDNSNSNSKRTFSLNATLKDDVEEVTSTYATKAWQVLTQQTTFIGPFHCHLHLQTKIGNVITRHCVETKSGSLDLEGLWDQPLSNSKDESSTTTPTGMIPEENDPASNPGYLVNETYYNDLELPWGQPLSNSKDESSTTTPTGMMPEENDPASNPGYLVNETYYNDDATIAVGPLDASENKDSPEAPIVVVDPQPQVTPPKGTIFVQELSADGMLLGVRIQLPQSLLDAVPQFHVKLPPLVIALKADPNAQAIQLFLDELDLEFSTQSNDHFALAQVSCGTKSNPNSCPWYIPVVTLVSDTLKRPQDLSSTVILTVDASKSFLEQMLGTRHGIVLNRFHLDQTSFLGRRRLLQMQMDCVVARDAQYGNLFELSLCMFLNVNKGIAVEGMLNIYGYGGSVSGDLGWQQMDGKNVMTLNGTAQVALELKNMDEKDIKMNLIVNASLDLENLNMSIHTNNTGEWWAFRVMLEGGVEYLDPEDTVVLRLDNAFFEALGEQYLYSKGAFRLDNLNEKISMVVTDPRLEMAVDGSVVDEALRGTWKLVYDSEDIMTGESEMSLIDGGVTIKSDSSGKLTTNVQAEFIYNYEGLSLDVQQARLEWAGDEKGDAAISIVVDDTGTMIKLEEKTHDHELSFNLVVADSPRAISDALVKWNGEELFTASFQLSVREFDMAVDVNGEAGDHEYSIMIQSEWDSDSPNLIQIKVPDALLQVDNEVWMKMTGTFRVLEPTDQGKFAGQLVVNGEAADRTFALEISGDGFSNETMLFGYKGESSLQVDDNLLWYELGDVSIKNTLGSDDYFGELKLETTKDDADVQFIVELNCDWDSEKEAFKCELPIMQLSFAGTTLTDAEGNMLLDLPGSKVELELLDEYTEDGNGYAVSMYGDYMDDILTGKVGKFMFVSDGITTMDAVLGMTFDAGDVSIGYILEDLVSESLIGLDNGGMTMGYNSMYWDELETLGIRAENMRVVMAGDPWVHGGMRMAVDLVNATLSMAMENNTTKLPIDFDFKISFGDQVNMAVSAISSQPPTSVTIRTSIRVYNLKGLTAEALNKPENAAVLADAFQDFVKNLIASSEGTQQERQLLATQRRLAVTLLADTAKIYNVTDVDCLTDGDRPVFFANASCQTIFGGYELEVIDEDPLVVEETYIRATDKALEEGKLQESLTAADPESPLMVVGPLNAAAQNGAIEQNETDITVLPQATSNITVLPSATSSESGSTCQGVTFPWLTLVWILGVVLL